MSGAIGPDVRALLAEPTPRAARAVALELLDTLDREHARLGSPRDAEALHDFRVALRRLRSWLRAYRRDIRDSVRRKSVRRLGELARASTQSRDLEVHLAWLRVQLARLKPAERTGARWLVRRLTTDKRRADAAFREALGAEYGEMAARLRKKLARYAVAVLEQAPGDRWAHTAAGQVQDAFHEFRRRLALVTEIRDDERLHRARIAGKRLRYLIEPLADVVEGGPAAVASLKRVQDLLGTVHDAHVLARTLRRLGRSARGTTTRARTNVSHGLSALGARLAGRRSAAWRAFADDWRVTAFEPLAANVHTIVMSLREIAGSGIEIERKYLLKKLPAEARRAPVEEIEQGYLPGTVLVERVRRVKSADGVRYIRTVKSGSGLVRTELEEDCTLAVYRALWPLTKGKRIQKRRYRVADTGHLWEIDEFTDRRLVLAEIELASARDAVAIPDWLARTLVREVTGEVEYLNHSLAR